MRNDRLQTHKDSRPSAMARRVNLSSTILYNLLILWILNPQNLTNNSFLKEKSSKNSNGFVGLETELETEFAVIDHKEMQMAETSHAVLSRFDSIV
jgi:hypothetical protein